MKKIILSIFFILILSFLFFFWGGTVLTRITIDNKISEMRDSIDFSDESLFTLSSIDHQPELIKNYFQSVLADSIFLPKLITIEQTAQFKTDINSDWRPLKATQYFSTKTPSFLWDSEMKTSKFFWVNAIDSYFNGKGNMLIKFNSSVTVADSWGIELDKSGLFRYISEAVLFPTKLLPSKNLMWSILDSNIAEIKFIDNEISIVAKLFFDSTNRITKIETFDKYRALDDGYEKSLYTIYLSNYKLFEHSFTIPTYFEVEWDLPNGKFKYGKFNIETIKYE
jgi:Family of unknown function (DUF6920)